MLSSSHMHVVFAGMLIIIQSVCPKRCIEVFERALKKQLVTGEYSSGGQYRRMVQGMAEMPPHCKKQKGHFNLCVVNVVMFTQLQVS